MIHSGDPQSEYKSGGPQIIPNEASSHNLTAEEWIEWQRKLDDEGGPNRLSTRIPTLLGGMFG